MRSLEWDNGYAPGVSKANRFAAVGLAFGVVSGNKVVVVSSVGAISVICGGVLTGVFGVCSIAGSLLGGVAGV